MPSTDRVSYALDGHVATITYARPEKLNAIDGAMRDGATSPAPSGSARR